MYRGCGLFYMCIEGGVSYTIYGMTCIEGVVSFICV